MLQILAYILADDRAIEVLLSPVASTLVKRVLTYFTRGGHIILILVIIFLSLEEKARLLRLLLGDPIAVIGPLITVLLDALVVETIVLNRRIKE